MTFIAKASDFTKNRLNHSLKLKTDSVTESAFNSVIVILRKDLALLKPESVTDNFFKKKYLPEFLLKTVIYSKGHHSLKFKKNPLQNPS